MPLTVADIEAELLTLVGPYLTRVGLDGTTSDGTNVSLRGPIRRAVRRLGIETADSHAVADGDLADIGGDTYETFLDLAELRTLELCWGNWAKFDQQAGEERQFLDQLRMGIERRIKTLTERLGSLAYPAEQVDVITPGASASGLITAGQRMPTCLQPDPRTFPGRPGWQGRSIGWFG